MNKKEFTEALSSSERRGGDRKKLIVDVHFSGGDATGIANTRDIGIGGLYMTTNAKLEIGMPIFMQISMGEKQMALNGVVVYSDPGYGVGVRFQDLARETEEYLKEELNLE
ncbi:MAG TPA: PilZ domain-containing protein [Pyrinomonadaceae bacterium]|nr:PilZ domain-containing protein [Pyrinomonadaceae bacterium]